MSAAGSAGILPAWRSGRRALGSPRPITNPTAMTRSADIGRAGAWQHGKAHIAALAGVSQRNYSRHMAVRP